MKFTAEEVIEAPVARVFERVTDFRKFEEKARDRGAEVRRVDALQKAGPGMTWEARFELRGRRQEMSIELTDLARPERLELTSRSPAMAGALTVDLTALAPDRTRMIIETALRPQTLSARLLVQSLKLARTSLVTRYRQRIARFAREIEEDGHIPERPTPPS